MASVTVIVKDTSNRFSRAAAPGDTLVDGDGNPIGGGSGVADGDYGDITVSGAGTVWNLDAGVVTTTELGGDITTAGKALLDDANAAAQRTTLGLGTAATAASTDFAAASHTHAAAAIVSGTVDTARLGSGVADGTTYLRGDQTWATVPGGGLTQAQVLARGCGA